MEITTMSIPSAILTQTLSKWKNEVQCSFIESIRYGTYDKYGQIYVNMFQSSNQIRRRRSPLDKR